MTYQNVWGAVKVVLQGKFMAINTYIRKEQSLISNLSIILRKIGKQERNEPRHAEDRKC